MASRWRRTPIDGIKYSTINFSLLVALILVCVPIRVVV